MNYDECSRTTRLTCSKSSAVGRLAPGTCRSAHATKSEGEQGNSLGRFIDNAILMTIEYMDRSASAG